MNYKISKINLINNKIYNEEAYNLLKGYFNNQLNYVNDINDNESIEIISIVNQIIDELKGEVEDVYILVLIQDNNIAGFILLCIDDKIRLNNDKICYLLGILRGNLTRKDLYANVIDEVINIINELNVKHIMAIQSYDSDNELIKYHNFREVDKNDIIIFEVDLPTIINDIEGKLIIRDI